MSQPLKGYKYRLYPTPSQTDSLNKVFGCTRFVWNHFLAESATDYNTYQLELAQYESIPAYLRQLEMPIKPEVPNLKHLSASLTALKAEPGYEWLNDVPAVPLQQSLRNLSTAYSKFLGSFGPKATKAKSGYPKFKKYKGRQSASYVDNAFDLRAELAQPSLLKLKLARIETLIDVQWTRELPSQPKTATVSRDPSGHYYVSFNCEYEPKLTNGQAITGIDLGIKDFATLSDGGEIAPIANPKHYHKQQRRLAHLQRTLARQVLHSKGWHKTQQKIAKLHQHIANQRKDHLHKLSRQLVDENQAICIENLAVTNMAKKRHLSKSIMTAGRAMFCQFLTYKAEASQ